MDKIIRLILIVFTVIACNPSEELPESAKKLVVDGWIEQGIGAQVLTTYTSPFLTELDSVSALTFMASHAKVSVSKSDVNEVLTLHPSTLYFPPLVYEGSEIKGEVGSTYQIEVTLQGQVYSATATIPAPPVIDSVWIEPVNDSLGVVKLVINDPPLIHNYYRIFSQRLGIDKRPIPVYLPNYSDELFEGTKFELPVFMGKESNLNSYKGLYFSLHNSIRIKVCSMDKATYDYWNSVQLQLSGSKNPFASNGKALSTNLSGNAIGYWCAYGVCSRTIYPADIKK